MALGADRGGVLRMVMGQGLALALVGVAIGFGLAALAARFLSGALYGVGAADPIAWGSAFAVLLLAASLANLIPALRAMRVDPVTRAPNGLGLGAARLGRRSLRSVGLASLGGRARCARARRRD